MKKLVHIGLAFIFLFSCKTNKKDNNIINSEERSIQRALLNGYYSQIDDNIGVAIYQNNIYYFSNSPNGFSNDKFLLHLIKKDNSFDNKDFLKEKYVLNDSLKGNFSSLDIVNRRINIESYESIRIGQFKRNEDLSTKNIWVKQVKIQDINDQKEQYLNQFSKVLNKNLLNIDFEEDLTFGTFFKTNSDFYVLVSDPNLFFITKDKNATKDKIMLHFIREDNSFKNLSFNFENKEYQQYLEQPYKNLKIAKINLPLEIEFQRIRIGQFNSNGNIWVQELIVEEILKNPLLKYNNEFQNSKN